MPYLNADHTFHYNEQVSDGPSVLLLHSTGVGSRQWIPYFRKLPNRHLLAINLLGYSPSDPWNNKFNISVDYDAAEHLLLMQSEPVDLVGHSYGGFLALQLAKKHPDKVRSLLLFEPVAWAVLKSSPNMEIISSFAKIQSLFSNPDGISKVDWLESFVDYWNTQGTWSNLPNKTQSIWLEQFEKVFAEVSMLCLDTTPLSHWETIKHPTCITISSGSPAQEKEVCRLLGETLPNTTIIHHEGGHMAPVSHISTMALIIENWISKIH